MTDKENIEQEDVNKWVRKMYDFYYDLRMKGEVATNAELLAACRAPDHYRDIKCWEMVVVGVKEKVDLKLRSVKFVPVSDFAAPESDMQTTKEALRVPTKAAGSSVSMADRQAALERVKHIRRQADMAVIKSKKAKARADMVAAARARNAANGRTAHGTSIR